MGLENGMVLEHSPFGPTVDSLFTDKEYKTDWNSEIIDDDTDYYEVYLGGKNWLPDLVVGDKSHIENWLDNHFYDDKVWFIKHYGIYGVEETINELITTEKMNDVDFFKEYVDCKYMEAE